MIMTTIFAIVALAVYAVLISAAAATGDDDFLRKIGLR